MKSNSDNYRESAMLGIIKRISKKYKNIVIFEPSIKSSSYEGFIIENDIDTFKEKCDLIIANRLTDDINDVKNKVLSRDQFGIDE